VNIDETIDAFRRGTLELDCKKMVLRQRKDHGEVYEGPGYIRQTPEGALTFKIYVTAHENVKPLAYFAARLQRGPGKLYSPDVFYDLTVLAQDGATWTATDILPNFNWDMSDQSIIAIGQVQSIHVELERPTQPDNYLRLYFFEEYALPLHRMSRVEQHGREYEVTDRAEFEACNCRFEVRVRQGSGDTVIEATSETNLPPAFETRIQEALQYLTAKSAFWRARAEGSGERLCIELLSPRREFPRTLFDPPISPASPGFYEHGWNLFGAYLVYVVAHTEGPQWNPVAYHLYNAREASAGSLDAWAVGVSIAVEAVAHLIPLSPDDAEAARVTRFQSHMREIVDVQTDLDGDLVERMHGLIGMMAHRRPKDVLHALVRTGHIDKKYIEAWDALRNRHVHPRPKDLKQIQGVDYQEMVDRIHRAEVILWQLTFYLIGYEGPYIDYGTDNFPSKNYPTRPADAGGGSGSEKPGANAHEEADASG